MTTLCQYLCELCEMQTIPCSPYDSPGMQGVIDVEPDGRKDLQRSYLRYLWPAVVSYLFSQLAPFADSTIISWTVGHDAFAAIGLSLPLFYIFNIASILPGVGAGVMMSVACGKGDVEAAGRASTMAIVGAGCVAVTLTCVGLAGLPLITKALGADENLAVFVSDYLRVILAGLLFYFEAIVLYFLLLNDKAPRLAMAGMVVMNVVNIILDCFFIISLDMGITGAALATVAGQFAGCLTFSLHFLRGRNVLIRWRSFIGHFRDFAVLIKLGSPHGFNYLFKFLRIWLINLLLLSLAGNVGLAASVVILNLVLVISSLTEGIASSVQPLTSLMHGENNVNGVRSVIRISWRWAVMILAPILLVLMIYPQAFLACFSTGPELRRIILTGIRIFSVSILFNCLNSIWMYFSSAIERPLIGTQTAFLREVLILLPACWVLSRWYGINGVWAGFVVAEVLTFLIIRGRIGREYEREIQRGQSYAG